MSTDGYTNSSKQASTRIASFYQRTLDIALRYQRITIGVFFATMALTVGDGHRNPQRLLPDPGHRDDLGLHAEARTGHLARGDDAADARNWATS